MDTAEVWWSGLVVNVRSDQRSCSTSGPVSTQTGDHLRAGKPHQYVTSHPG